MGKFKDTQQTSKDTVAKKSESQITYNGDQRPF